MKSDNKREARACEYRKAGKETSGSEGDIFFCGMYIFNKNKTIFRYREKDRLKNL